MTEIGIKSRELLTLIIPAGEKVSQSVLRVKIPGVPPYNTNRGNLRTFLGGEFVALKLLSFGVF